MPKLSPLLALLMFGGCSPEPQSNTLVDMSAWQATAASSDPLIAHDEASLPCLAGGWSEELSGIEVDTGDCPYLSLSSQTIAPFLEGDTLEVTWWHKALNAELNTQGHIALLVDDTVVWEAFVDIPGDADAYSQTTNLDFDAPAGTPIIFHLHNHGANTWNLNQVNVLN